nr:MAG TPA: hypothetical protein [Caudoviricetes sp.]
MRENLKYMISTINAATISAVAHRSNGLIDNNYDRAQIRENLYNFKAENGGTINGGYKI